MASTLETANARSGGKEWLTSSRARSSWMSYTASWIANMVLIRAAPASLLRRTCAVTALLAGVLMLKNSPEELNLFNEDGTKSSTFLD